MTGFTYKSYNFGEAKDPIIDEVRTVLQQTGWSYKRVEDESGVTSATLHNWFDGKTRRPQAASINAVLRSMGFKLGVVPNVVVSMVEAKPASSHRRMPYKHLGFRGERYARKDK